MSTSSSPGAGKGFSFNRLRSLGRLRYCPVCENSLRRFVPFGVPPRNQARCPECRALERHRALRLYLTARTNLFDDQPKAMLHVAPESCLAGIFQAIETIDYLSADLDNSAMVKMDLTRIQYPNESFDVILCSHVLEHIQDDHKAMKELYRVLKPDGWAILQVPITAKKTFEDPSVTSPEERTRLFGQHDHVRRYGPDYENRLAAAGFAVQADRFTAELPPWQRWRYGIPWWEVIHMCRKPPSEDGTGATSPEHNRQRPSA